jgi:hypothetical protein
MKKRNLKDLLSLARQESCPEVCVTDSVMQQLASIRVRCPDPYRAYTWVGSISAAMAACILIAAGLFWQSHSDSISEIITYVSWATQ